MTFDEVIGIKLASGVSTNDAGKQFPTDMYNRKTLRKVIDFFQRMF